MKMSLSGHRWRFGALALLASVFAGCAVEEVDGVVFSEGEQAAVYGSDDRTEVYAVADPALRALALQSAVALIDTGYLDASNPADLEPLGWSLGESYQLCSGERFYNEVTAASCSGTLIADDLVLTAGHCVPNLATCRSYRFVFGYMYTAPGVLGPITSDDVFMCQSLVFRSDYPDMAVVRLDRPATPRHVPAPVRRGTYTLSLNAPVTVIGFPSGIPAKVDSGGHVIDPNYASDAFETTADTFGGSSGSGVFDSLGRLVGIIVEGADDYVWNGSCYALMTYPANGGNGGEIATYGHRAVSRLCASGYTGGPCSNDAWCQPCAEAGDCPTGWSCQAGRCTQDCNTDGDCRADHSCIAGNCAPKVTRHCEGAQVWVTEPCAATRLESTCTAPQWCADGTCSSCEGAAGCIAGSTRCVGVQVEVCVADDHGCTRWELGDCPTGKSCSGGACMDVPSCTSECELDATRCRGNAIERCAPDPVGSCLVWQGGAECAVDEQCDLGVCVQVTPSPDGDVSPTDGSDPTEGGSGRGRSGGCSIGLGQRHALPAWLGMCLAVGAALLRRRPR